MGDTKRKYIIKGALDESILSKNEYNGYSLRHVITLYDKTIIFFDTKEDAESYIYDNECTKVTILEVFI